MIKTRRQSNNSGYVHKAEIIQFTGGSPVPEKRRISIVDISSDDENEFVLDNKQPLSEAEQSVHLLRIAQEVVDIAHRYKSFLNTIKPQISRYMMREVDDKFIFRLYRNNKFEPCKENEDVRKKYDYSHCVIRGNETVIDDLIIRHMNRHKKTIPVFDISGRSNIMKFFNIARTNYRKIIKFDGNYINLTECMNEEWFVGVLKRIKDEEMLKFDVVMFLNNVNSNTL